MASELEQFDQLSQEVTETTSKAKSDNEAAKAARQAAMNEAMQKTLAESQAEYMQKRGSLSNSVNVTRVFGFGANGNIIQTQKADPTNNVDRKVGQTSKNVGYQIENIGTVAIPYMTETFADDGNGHWVGTPVRKELQPGETAMLSRKYMTLFGADPTISNKFANGKLVRSSSGAKALPGVANLDAELEAYNFNFSDKNNSVNDESIKTQIGEQVNDGEKTRWVVLPEYQETFGYLNNTPERKQPAKKKGLGLDGQDLAANYIYRLAQEQGVL